MPRTQVACPNCQQPVPTEVEQLFDLTVDPEAKERLLGGAVNVIRCPNCAYQGNLATPVVYHDPSKEILLTFFPPEMNRTMEEQERTIGPLINKVVNNLKQEDRKGYLFKPQQMFTYQTLVETILQADGITKEMIESQKMRMDLLQRLVGVSGETLPEVIKQEDAQIDGDFFNLLNRLFEGTLAARDEAGVQQLSALQAALLEHSSFGAQVKEQAEEIEAARKSLQDAGKELTREKLLEIVIDAADKEVRLNALVSLARPGLDYVFFQTLSERIETAESDEKERLTKLRDDLLEITRQIDEQLQARLNVAQKNLETLLEQENPAEVLEQNPGIVDDFFIQVVNQSIVAAEEKKDSQRLGKLEALLKTLQKLVSPGYNPALLQDLIEAPDDATRYKVVEQYAEEITPEFVESLSGMLMQLENEGDKELAEKVRSAYRAVLRASMQKGMKEQG